MPARIIAVFLILLFSSLYFFPREANSAITSCSATVTPGAISPGTSSLIGFNVVNGGAGNAVWVKITAPSADYTITAGSPGTVTLQSSTVAVYTGFTISEGGSQGFDVSVTGGASETGSAAWTVQISDDAGGANAYTCSGTTSTRISNNASDQTPPALTNLKVTEITSSSARITWTTDEAATTLVQYGLTESYTSSKSDSSLTTAHTIDITGLTSNTVYYFAVRSADENNNSAGIEGNTFSSAKPGETITETKTLTKTETKTETKTVLVKDKVPPGISLKTSFAKPYTKAPLISGTAIDDNSVGNVQYSIDNGANWLSVDTLKSQFTKSVRFEFLPSIIDDGDYLIRIRAYDHAGNVGVSSSYKLVIDRLPPTVGSSIISIGPQILEPHKGILFTLMGLDQKITLSSVGGADQITLFAGKQQFDLVKNPESGLWSGKINFENSGTYKLKVTSKDGAGNVTQRQLNTIVVLDNGKISAQGESQVTLYYFEPSINRFVVWDGRPYGQENPQKTNNQSYRLFVPAGKYYMEAKANGYKVLKSEIFNLNRSTAINSNFKLQKSTGISLGPFSITTPGFLRVQTPIALNYPRLSEPDNEASLLNKEFPEFSLSFDSKPYTNLDLRGKSTVVSFLNSWSPYTFEQIAQINEISGQKGINFLIIFPQESNSSVTIFRKRGQYNLPIIADPDGSLVSPLNLQLLPTHIFVDRKGIVQDYKVGVMGGEEIVGAAVR